LVKGGEWVFWAFKGVSVQGLSFLSFLIPRFCFPSMLRGHLLYGVSEMVNWTGWSVSLHVKLYAEHPILFANMFFLIPALAAAAGLCSGQ
jgi:hypothetical protein